MVVPAWLSRAAAAHPDRVALETLEGALSYAQLDDRARRAAARLEAGGVRPGDRVALALEAGQGFVVALHACLRLGAVAMPVDLRLGDRERAAMVEGAASVIDGPLDDGGDERAPAGPLDQGGVSARAAGHDLDAPALVVHTSGTSGAPKPVALTYGNLLWSAMGSAVALGLDPGERWLCPLPLSHVGGLSVLVRSAIHGTTAVLHSGFDPHAVARSLAEERVTSVSLVPTMVRRLLEAGMKPAPSLRFALVGGAGLDPSLAARAREAGVPVVETYGLTEACSQVATDGVPLFCARVEISAQGEILVAGPTVAPGAADADGFLNTGDLGSLDEHGRLVITGRRADTIVTGGENVAPAEVEAALLEHPAVAEAAVHGRADPEWGEAVAATVVLREGASASAEELRSHAAARLARFKVPKAVDFAQALPRTASGKLRRAELR
jgi:o-succinylbenzoate---CoA ligase